jgi:hypothetical protein
MVQHQAGRQFFTPAYSSCTAEYLQLHASPDGCFVSLHIRDFFRLSNPCPLANVVCVVCRPHGIRME